MLDRSRRKYIQTETLPEFDRVHHWSDPTATEEMLCKSYDPQHYYAGQYMKRAGNIGAYMRKAENLGPTISVSRRKLELMIAAQRRTGWDYIKERGKFDSRRMVAAMSADPNVFKIKEDVPEIDTAVSVVVDLSGSMNGPKRSIATDTAIVLFECLSKIGVAFEVSGFDCTFSFPDKESSAAAEVFNDAQSNRGKHGRYDSVHSYIFKSFKDRPFDARPYIMGLDNCGLAGQSNADGCSIEVIHERLFARPEKRKIMFVLSDGSPACASTSGRQPWMHLKNVVKDIEKKGTNIIGIGIATDIVKEFYPKYVVCNKAEDLTGATLKLLGEVLLPKRKKA